MTKAAKLNPADLERALGRGNAAAFLHMERQIGVIVGATTLPEAVEQIETNLPAIEALQAQMTEQQTVTADHDTQLGALPPHVETPREEYLETQVRSLAETIAALTKRLEALEQGTTL